MNAGAGAVSHESRRSQEESNDFTQYKSAGLDCSANGWVNDWNFGEIQLRDSSSLSSTNQLLSKRESIRAALVDREGKVTKAWCGLTTFPAIELALCRTTQLAGLVAAQSFSDRR
jgi:hypothetical protein